MWANWIRTRLAAPRCRPTPRRSRRPAAIAGGPPRPRLDSLEDRTVPAAFRLGSTAFDTATAVAADPAGNLFAAGTFNGTVDFDPGAGVTNLISTGNDDGYLAKYTAAGALAWAGQLIDGSINKLAVAADGAVFATGTFTGTTDFDFGPGVTSLTAAPFGSAFVAKYAAGGGLVWAKKLGGTDASTSGDAITLDGAGNVYSSGVLSNGSADMDPGAGTFTLTNLSGNANSFIEKLDPAGNFVWAKQFANDPSIAAGVWTAGLGVDAAQNVYVTGIFTGRVDFDTGPATTYTSTFDTTFPSGDGYAAKLTAAGDLAYLVRIGSAAGREDGNGIAVDAAGDAYVTGEFTNTTTIDATAGDTTLTSAGNDDVFVLRLGPTGGLDWARRIGSAGNDGGQAIALDGADNLYLSGYFAGTVDFDPNGGVSNRTYAGGFVDAFALRLTTDSTFVNAWGLGGTDYEFGNAVAVTGAGTVAVAGRFQGTADFDPGPGTLNLTSAGDNDAFVATIAQAAPNRPPVAADDSYATDEEIALTINAPGVLGNDADPDGNPLTAVRVAAPAHGSVTVNANGSFTYRPANNYSGPDSFTYKATDGSLDSNVATVNLTVRPVNDAPFPSPVVQDVTTAEDTPLPGQVRGIDPDGDPLTFALVQAPAHGSLVFNADGTFTYTPAADYVGPDAFVFKVSDPSGASNSGAVSITVTPVNDAPAAVADAYTVDEDGTLTVTADPVTRLHMVSEPGDFIGQGLTYDFTPATAVFSGTRNFDNGASLDIDPAAAGEFWFLDFAAPGDAALTRGAYPNAMRFPFQTADRPGLDVSGNGRGSNTLTGQFTVYDAAFTGSTLTRFAAAFEQHSEGKAPALVGWVMLNSTFGAGGGVLANDTDAEGDLLLGATLVSGPAHGTLAFNGDGTFAYTPNPDFNGTDTFTYRTTDGRADSGVATATITVRPVNDAPAATDGSAATDEDTPVNGTLTAADVDGDALTYAVVDRPAHGVLTDFNPATGAFTYNPIADSNGADSFTFKVNDGTTDSNTATFTVTVRPVNDAPVAPDTPSATDEDTPLTGTLAAIDVEGDPLTYSLVQEPNHGTATVNPDGTFTYTPDPNFHGPDGFTYKANDGSLDSFPAIVSITVRPVNDAPAAADGTLTTAEDTAKAGTVAATDVDGDRLTYRVVAGPAHGTLTAFDPATGDFTYLPGPNYNGFDGFTFKANDGTVDSNTAAVAIAVTPVNDAPVAVGGGGTTAEDTPLAGTVTATDIDGDALTYSLAGGPAHGTVTVNADGTFTYTPAANYNGSDSFTFQATDGALDSTAATVAITITPVNDAPAADDQTVSIAEDTTRTGSVTATDVDNDSLTYSLIAGPSHGTVTVSADGAFVYTPAADYNGPDGFTFRANDGQADSNVATVRITLTPVNDPPVATDGTLTTAEDTAASGTLTATDIDSPTLTFSVVGGPSHGTLTTFDPATGAFTYTPGANYNESDSITFQANDGQADSRVATVSIAVTPVNDAPAANSVSTTTAEDTPLTGTVTASDVDGDPLAFSLVAGPAHGTITVAADGAYTYTPAADYNGPDSFTFKANDGAADSDVATVSITVTPVDDAPVAAPGTVTTAEDTPATGTVTSADVDGPAPTYSVVAGPAHGTLTGFNSSTGAFTYTPNANYNGTDAFTFRASDGTLDSDAAAVSITVTPVNDAPVAADGSLSTAANVPANGSVGATDVDGDPLSYTVVSGPSHGTLTAFDGSTGAFTYAPAAGYGGPDAFTFRASDGTADSNTATVSITVTANNHSPVARNDSGVTAEDTPVAVAVLANDTDPDGDALTVSAVTQPAHGTVAINVDGTVTYTPAADFHGTDAFTYTADDGHGGTDTATVALTVRSVNDAPVANDADFSTDEDTALRGRLTATDPDGRPLTYRRVTGPAHGRLTLYPNGSFVYRPAADYNGLDSFTFKATDGALTSNVATVTITVRPVNDAPDATNDSYTTDAGDELTVPAAGVLANDTDVDGDALTAVLAAGPAHGRLTLNADGSFRYMPAAGFAGTDSFTYRANDGTVSGNPATVAIRVKATAVTAGQATGGGFVDGGARHFDLNVQSRARPGGFALSGTVAFRDEATGVTLDSTAIQSFRVDATGTRAVITGSATVNGRKGYTFTVIVQDLAEPGVGRDTFRIQIAGPNGYDFDSLDGAVNLGVLDGGNIQVRQKP